MKISSRDRKVAELIRDRQPFETYGAFKATAEIGLTVWQSGQLSGKDLEEFREATDQITYVVWSYSTPIAWYTVAGGWYKVDQKFSVTTSKHQGKLYLTD